MTANALTALVSDQAILAELAEPHPLVPTLSRGELYTLITRMYLDAPFPADVSAALEAEFAVTLSETHIDAIRREAAHMAERAGVPELRRRWIYRYRRLTLNNLAKEYMFIKGSHDFLGAKRELAEEIETLAAHTPEGSLWIAVNEALGRNNVSMRLVRHLIAYSETSRALGLLVRPLAHRQGITVEDAMVHLAERLESTPAAEAEPNTRHNPNLAVLAGELGCDVADLTPDMIDHLHECRRFAHTDLGGCRDIAVRIAHGADQQTVSRSLISRVMDDDDILTPPELGRLSAQLCSDRVPTVETLDRLRSYCERHIGHHSIRRRVSPTHVEPADPDELKQLLLLRTTLTQLLALTDAETFFSAEELRVAEQCGLTRDELNDLLKRLNALRDREALTWFLGRMLQNVDFAFPADRYYRLRFSFTPPPAPLAGSEVTPARAPAQAVRRRGTSVSWLG